MKGHHIVGFFPRKRRVTTTPSAHRIPDLLAGDFGATRPDEAWVGDITYIRTRQGFMYLAFVLDLASRRVVGVSMASHLKASLVADALREATGTRGSQGGFNWWSQHLVMKEVHDECCEASGGDSCDARPDAVAWSAVWSAA